MVPWQLRVSGSNSFPLADHAALYHIDPINEVGGMNVVGLGEQYGDPAIAQRRNRRSQSLRKSGRDTFEGFVE